MLLYGPPGTGKTKFLSKIAKDSNIACIKMVIADKLLRVPDKSTFIMNTFDQCTKAESSILILDNLDRIIEWNSYGGRYDNKIVQTVMTLTKTNRMLCDILDIHNKTKSDEEIKVNKLFRTLKTI